MENIEIIIALLAGVTLLAILSQKINFPFPILLILIGLVIALIPNLPVVELNSDVVFLIFLPPILYGSAWGTNWHEFKANMRPILLSAIGLVIFTTCLVALVAHAFIPGFGWAEGFVLGAIVSPPDAVAASAVTKHLGLHRRLNTILEGESLINDASGLIAYKYGIIAVATGNFIFWNASVQFLWMAIAGIAIGLLIGYILYLLHKFIVEEPTIETVITFLSPYIAYLIAEHFHVSGVLAVVAAGLFLTSKQMEIFSHSTRIKAYATWETVLFILNGVIFILIGLQLKKIMKDIEKYPLDELFFYGLIISVLVIIVRFVWVYPAAILPRVFSKRIREKEYFDIRNVFIFSWSGMRGVVSMAAALALPYTVNEVYPFPNRDMIVFLTFCVVIFTLVVQGLTLAPIIKWMKLPKYSILEDEQKTRVMLTSASIEFIEENFAFNQISDEVLAQIKSKYEIRFNKLFRSDLPNSVIVENKNRAEEIFNQYVNTEKKLINMERNLIKLARKDGQISNEVLLKIERELDLEESQLQ
ncbi:MAG: Na+/H+ antiporter [Bacteroidetes bacterium]|nr:MAG: Na+/H+ antiporter [Bacteroidota bacterium]